MWHFPKIAMDHLTRPHGEENDKLKRPRATYIKYCACAVVTAVDGPLKSGN